MATQSTNSRRQSAASAPVEHVRPVPTLVSVGIMSASEYDALDDQDKAELESETAALFARYGAEFLVRERRRLRWELQLIGKL